MKRKSPPTVFVIQAAVLLLSLTFLSTSFATRPGSTDRKKFSVLDADKDEQDSDIEAQRRRSDQSGDDSDSDDSSLEQRGRIAHEREDEDEVDNNAISDSKGDVMEELLAKSDAEILDQLSIPEVRNRVLAQVKKYEEEANAFYFNFTKVEKKMNEDGKTFWSCLMTDLRVDMEEILRTTENYTLFLEDAKIAKKYHFILAQKRGMTTEMLGFYPESQEKLEDGLRQANPEWAAAFQEYRAYLDRIMIIDFMPTTFFQNKWQPSVVMLQKESTGISLDPEQLKRTIQEDLSQEREIVGYLFIKVQLLIEKARNSRNPNLVKEKIRKKNEELDKKIEFQDHQIFLASLHGDLKKWNSSDDDNNYDYIKASMAEGLLNEYSSVTLDEFISSPEIVSKWKIQKKDYEEVEQKVDEMCHFRFQGEALRAFSSIKEHEIYCLYAMSQLRFDATPGLNSIREKLKEFYQQNLSVNSFISALIVSESENLPSERNNIFHKYNSLASLVDEWIQAFIEGRTQAVKALAPLIEECKAFLSNERRANRAESLLLRAEARAFLMKMKTEPAIRQIEDEEMASFPWRFGFFYENNLKNFQHLENDGKLEATKAERLQVLKNKLAREETTPIPSTRPASQFGRGFLVGEERTAALEKLKNQNEREAVLDEAQKRLGQLLELFSNEQYNDIMKGESSSNDLLLQLLLDQTLKVQQAMTQSDDAFLNAIEKTRLLYPYVEKKIELCKRPLGIDSSQWSHFATGFLLEQLDELAISRFLAEQTIAERNDRYLTHAFDEIRSEDERDFQSDLKSQVQAQRSKQFRYLLRMVEAAWWTAVSLLSVYSLWLIYNYNLAS